MDPDKQWEKHIKGNSLHIDTAPKTQKQLDSLRVCLNNQNEKMVNHLHSLKLEMRENHIETSKDLEYLKKQAKQTNGSVKKNTAWRMEYGNILLGHVKEKREDERTKKQLFFEYVIKGALLVAGTALGINQLKDLL